MKILIVGAGATGSVLGYFAKNAGADVTFFVKPKYAEQVSHGLTLHEFKGTKKSPHTHLLSGLSVRSDASQLKNETYDYVFVTVPSPAIREGDWLEQIAAALPDTTIVSFQPGIEDRTIILEKTGVPTERLIDGSIPFLSYLAPLPGQSDLKSGYGFWFPPLATGSFAGETTRTKSLVELMKKGGYPAKYQLLFKEKTAALSLLLTLTVIGLEKSDWSFDKFFNTEKLYIVAKSAEEVYPWVYEKQFGNKPKVGLLTRLTFKPLLIKTILRSLQFACPFDAESFFKVHFSKVDTQMHNGFQEILALRPKESLSASVTLLAGKG